METIEQELSKLLKSAIDKFICYKAHASDSENFNMHALIQSTLQDLKSDLTLPTSEDIEIQKIPPSKTKKLPLTEKDFKITNLDTGKELDIRDESHDDFLREISVLADTGDYSANLSTYFEQKQRINKALWQAIENNQPEICKLLLSRKNYGDLVAQTNARGPNEETSLHMAGKLGLLKICEILLEYGEMTDVNAKDVEGCTPLHLACRNGHYLTAQFLIRSGTLINSMDNMQNTPMHYAALCGSERLIKYLFTKFSDLNLMNCEGLTPLDILKSKDLVINEINTLENISINRGEFSRDSFTEFEAEWPVVSFHDFEVIQILGRGSFGEVFLVRMKNTGQQFAMKVLRKDKVVGQNLVKYAMVERNVLSYIHHPFIVGLNYAFQSPQKLYLVLDYCAGGNLTSYIIRQRFFLEKTARFFLCEIILALEELHKHGIIYRDLKPDNIVIDSEGHALLTDFGLSKEGVQDNFSAKSFCGSIAYLAPEMIRRKGHGKAVDWYLLGVVFYEMLNGVPPFYSNNKEQLFFNIENTKAIIPGRISAEARGLLKKLLKKNPEKRIGSVRGAEEIKAHEFFVGVDWEKVARRETVPPIKPIVLEIPGYIPKAHIVEEEIDDEIRHLHGWTFVCE